ncbi:MAG: 6,7-dimethyl-8-ribityllumazine synthase [Candidatus Dormibacteria bacterium]
MRQIQGVLDGRGLKVCLVAARFNETTVERLVEGARRALLQHGVSEDDIELIWVPGAFEIAVAAAERVQRGGVDALVALGAVIRGETPHFEYVAQGAASGIAELGVRHRVAIGFGVLTVNTVEQAAERAGGKLGNKGWEAACAALELASVLGSIRGEG